MVAVLVVIAVVVVVVVLVVVVVDIGVVVLVDHGGELSDIEEGKISLTTELNFTRNSLNVMFEGISP